MKLCRPLFELLVGYLVGTGTGGYSGTMDDTKRPQLCSKVAQVRGDDWALIIADTMGVIREPGSSFKAKTKTSI